MRKTLHKITLFLVFVFFGTASNFCQAETFDCEVIGQISHPRLLLRGPGLQDIKNLIKVNSDFNDIHKRIISVSDQMLDDAAWKYTKDQYGYMADVGAMVKRMFYLCYSYRMTGNAKYLTKAKADLNTISGFTNTGVQSLNVGEFAFVLGLGYDWLFNDIDVTLRKKVRNCIYNFALLTQNDTRPFWTMESNWNQVCIGGLSFASMAIYEDGTAEMDKEAERIIGNILTKNKVSMKTYNQVGNYSEGPMYWKYGTTYEVIMLSTLEIIYGSGSTLLNNFINTPGFLESAQYMQFVTGPTYKYHNYADCTEARNILPAAFWMAKRLKNNNVLYLEKEMMGKSEYATSSDGHLPLALIYGKNIDLNNIEAPSLRVWEGGGTQPVVFARTGFAASSKFVGIKAGTPNNSHAHMDEGSFVYDSQGLRWAMELGKEDYNAAKENGGDNSYDQDAFRWNIFRHDNISHNTISIKKTSQNDWQHHVANAKATIDEVFNTTPTKGARVNMVNMLGLSNELVEATRTITIVDNKYLKTYDHFKNGSQSVDVYWNMVTQASPSKVDATTTKLTQGGKTVLLNVSSSNANVKIVMVLNRSTNPSDYGSSHDWERKNPGTVMVGYRATIPANQSVNLTTTLKDGPAASAAAPVNQFLLESPSTLTANLGLATKNETIQSRDVFIPSLVKEDFVIKYRNPNNSDVRISIYTMSGIRVYNNTFKTIAGNDIQVKFDGAKSGIYMCQLIDNEGTIVNRIIKE